MLTRTHRAWTGRVLCAVSAVAVLSAAVNLLAGGYSFHLGPFRLSSHSFSRDLAVAALSAIGAVVVWGRDAVDGLAACVIVAIERRAVWIAAALSFATLVVAVSAATWCACGSDAYGYVSQADLWTAGTLHVPQPLASVVPWPSAEWTLSPLGYRPATYRGAIVPTYAPGLPMAMALAVKITATRSAVFFVVPILGAVAVWSTFLLGRQFDAAVVGLSGALLLACSATFLFQVIQPMSDVPATAWWTLAALLVLRQTATSAFLAGLACSAAVLTRPNLVPLVLAFVPLVCSRKTMINAAWFFSGALPGMLGVAWIQNALYGSPLLSGYGGFRDIYALANADENLRLYPAWLWESHGPFIFVGLLSPFVWVMAAPEAVSRAARGVIGFALAFSALLFVAYIFYSPFENWTYTRFLLPAFPLLVLLAAWTPFALARRLGSPSAQALVLIGVVLIACVWLRQVIDRNVLTTTRGEARYIAAAQYVRATTTPDVLVVATQHSGSIRYYGGRTTVRYEWLQPRSLDQAIEAMRAMNRAPLIVLDDWEEAKFRERFRGQRWGGLDWPPRAEFQSAPKVRVYDPFDRERFEAPERLQTKRLPMPR